VDSVSPHPKEIKRTLKEGMKLGMKTKTKGGHIRVKGKMKQIKMDEETDTMII
jgi:hypothetical protein